MNWNETTRGMADAALEDAVQVSASDVGLDRRAASFLYRGEDFLAVLKSQDRALQYYGGFEYVSPECRQELGDWVFYSTQNERVEGHWSQYEG